MFTVKSPRFSFSQKRDKEYIPITDELQLILETVKVGISEEISDRIKIDLTSYIRSPQKTGAVKPNTTNLSCNSSNDDQRISDPVAVSPSNKSQARSDTISLKSNSTDSLYTLLHDVDIYNTDFSHDDMSRKSDDIKDDTISHERFSHSPTIFDREKIESGLEQLIGLTPSIHANETRRGSRNDKILESDDKPFSRSVVLTPAVRIQDVETKTRTLNPSGNNIFDMKDLVTFDRSTFAIDSLVSDDAFDDPFVTNQSLENYMDVHKKNIFNNDGNRDHMNEERFEENSLTETDIYLAIRGRVNDNDSDTDSVGRFERKKEFSTSNNEISSATSHPLSDEHMPDYHLFMKSKRLSEKAQMVLHAAAILLADNATLIENGKLPFSDGHSTREDNCCPLATSDSSHEKSNPDETSDESSLDISEKITISRMRISRTIEKLVTKHMDQRESISNPILQSVGENSSSGLFYHPPLDLIVFPSDCQSHSHERTDEVILRNERNMFEASIEIEKAGGAESPHILHESRDDICEYFDTKNSETCESAQSVTETIHLRLPVGHHNRWKSHRSKYQNLCTEKQSEESETLTLNELRCMSRKDPRYSRRETFLSDVEFSNQFGMSKSDWSSIPSWRQTIAKKQLGIF